MLFLLICIDIRRKKRSADIPCHDAGETGAIYHHITIIIRQLNIKD